MKLIDVIHLLQSRGHSISFRHRSDGGYIITQLDGFRFTGAKGNTYARTLIGSYNSKAREFQLQRINKQRQLNRKTPIPKELVRKIANVQRKWRKTHDITKGTIKTSSVRWILEHEGYHEALESLRKAERYASGLAYEENVNAMIEKLAFVDALGYDDEIVTLLENKKSNFKEEWIHPIYEIIYEWEKGSIEYEEMNRRIRDILRPSVNIERKWIKKGL